MDYLQLVKDNPPRHPEEEYWLRLEVETEVLADTLRKGVSRAYKKKYGGEPSTIPNLFARYVLAPRGKVNTDDFNLLVSYSGTGPMTMDQLVKESGIDTNIYSVARGKSNVWLTGMKGPDNLPRAFLNRQIEVKFEPKRLTIDEIVEAFEDRFSKRKPPKARLRKYEPPNHDLMALINLYDAHTDKLAISLLSGEKATAKSNRKRFESQFMRLLSSVKVQSPKEIWIPFGNDYYNTNGVSVSTKKGTVLDSSVFPQESFLEGVDLIVRCIEAALEIAPVKLILVPGNHDWDESWKAACCVAYYFSGNQDVCVDKIPQGLKCHMWGVNLLAFHHGDKKKSSQELANIISDRYAESWAMSKYRELHAGHEHKLRVEELPNMTFRWMRSLSPMDAFCHNGYFGWGKKSCSAYLYSKEFGLVTQFENLIL